MSQEWYPKYPALYRLDTMHLTLAEHGAYNLIIDWYMENRRPPPDNDRALAAIVHASVEEWGAVATTIRTLFRTRAGLLHHKRCDQELDKQDKLYTRRSEIGAKGAAVRHGKTNGLDGGGKAEANSKPASRQPRPKRAPATGQDRTGQDKRDTRACVDDLTRQWGITNTPHVVDLDTQLGKYRDYMAAHGKRHKNERAGFHNWLRKAEEFYMRDHQEPAPESDPERRKRYGQAML